MNRRKVADYLVAGSAVPLLCGAVYALLRAYKTYHPPRQPLRKKPLDIGLTARAVRIPVAKSRITLDAWLVTAGKGLGTVIVGHAIGKHKGFMLPYIAFLHRAGYDVLAFDHRNHGESDTDPVFWNMSTRFTDDMEAAIAFAKAQPQLGSSGLALLTISFSTFPALYVIPRGCPELKGLIFDSGPAYDVASVPGYLLTVQKALLPALFQKPIIFDVVKYVYAWAVNGMLNVKWPPSLDGFDAKLLFVANENDAVIPAHEVQRIAEQYPASERWLARETPHLLALKLREEEYTSVVLDFLRRAFGRERYMDGNATIRESGSWAVT